LDADRDIRHAIVEAERTVDASRCRLRDISMDAGQVLHHRRRAGAVEHGPEVHRRRTATGVNAGSGHERVGAG
jgi:hypothetical protein